MATQRHTIFNGVSELKSNLFPDLPVVLFDRYTGLAEQEIVQLQTSLKAWFMPFYSRSTR